VNCYGQVDWLFLTVLTAAAQRNHLAIAAYVLDHGAGVKLGGTHGCSARTSVLRWTRRHD
jgi:hypothetical protein